MILLKVSDLAKSVYYYTLSKKDKDDKNTEIIDKIKEISEKEEIIHTIQGAEPIGPKKMTDILVIAPCSRKYNS